MGMYTELVMATKVKNVPEVIEVLKYMTDPGVPVMPILPDHPLFRTSRWTSLFQCCSYYFVPTTVAKLEFDEIGNYWCLITRADLKNYSGEIELFIDWIRPHLDAHGDEMIGYSRYEETREPTIYYGQDDPV